MLLFVSSLQCTESTGSVFFVLFKVKHKIQSILQFKMIEKYVCFSCCCFPRTSCGCDRQRCSDQYLCATFSRVWIDRMLHVLGNSFCFVLVFVLLLFSVAMDIIMLIKYILSPIFDRAFLLLLVNLLLYSSCCLFVFYVLFLLFHLPNVII